MIHLFSPKWSYIHLSPYSFLNASIASINIPLCNLKSFFFHSRKPGSSAKPGKGSDYNGWKSVLFCFNLFIFPLFFFFFSSAAVLTDLGMTCRQSASIGLSLSIIMVCTWPFCYSVSSSPLNHFSKDLSFYFQHFPPCSAVTTLAQALLQGKNHALSPSQSQI